MRRLLLISIAAFSFEAAAYFQMDLMNSKKTTSNDAVQWTLTDWLSQKAQMSLADTWLSLHRQVHIFEFDPFAAHKSYTLTTKSATGNASVSQDAQEYGATFNVGLLSLSGEYEKTSTEIETYGGGVGLRLMGLSAQSTSLIGRYGWQRRQDLRAHEIWNYPYAEGELQLYLVKHFGLNGKYRYYFGDTSNLGNRREGHSVTAGLFFDLGVARLFAEVYQEPMQIKSSGTTTQEVREGYDGGIRFFF